ncbi:Ribonuclease [Afipia felis]|uniref:Ribonuclease n=1 Tax=Afipia felis TaxID=1035 RepID=A0A090MGF1_AFIFE|nr:MBL fold metallo-hydrolase [Afipia felis]CEG06726.1 Ribonuclease [Afipia felis]
MNTTLQFCGAAHTVTGSCYVFNTGQARFLVDCGMFQGSKTLKSMNYGPFPFDPRELDVLLLTHAHVDHSGLIPKLIKSGFKGRILATQETIDLCSYMLPDAGGIQEMEVKSLNPRNQARGRAPVTPIYTEEDAINSLQAFDAVRYETWVEAAKGVRARYWNAGHLLGSASIEIEIDNGAQEPPLRILMSGDIGPSEKLLQSAPSGPSGLDYVVCESTYGDTVRPHSTTEERRARLALEAHEAAAGKGPLIIPAFAVERTQELIVDLVDLMEHDRIPHCPIFLDSPLAIHATEVFRKHSAALQPDTDAGRLLHSPQLRFTRDVGESKAIERLSGFHIILAGSGMCEAGRIRYHLKNWLWRKQATVLLVGFQAYGTLGRILLDGAKAVRIQGEEIRVNARIRKMDEYSGHADGSELENWIRARLPIRSGLFLSHGEDAAIESLRGKIADTAIPTNQIFAPVLDEIYALDPQEARSVPSTRRRLQPEAVIRLDSHNDMSKFILALNDKIEAAADERARRLIIRRLNKTLDELP